MSHAGCAYTELCSSSENSSMYGVHQIRCIPGLEWEASYTQCFINIRGWTKSNNRSYQ